MTIESSTIEFATIEEALEDIATGKMIVVVDDEDRENEGDLVMAAEHVTPDAINFMATHARGWICLALTLYVGALLAPCADYWRSHGTTIADDKKP